MARAAPRQALLEGRLRQEVSAPPSSTSSPELAVCGDGLGLCRRRRTTRRLGHLLRHWLDHGLGGDTRLLLLRHRRFRHRGHELGQRVRRPWETHSRVWWLSSQVSALEARPSELLPRPSEPGLPPSARRPRAWSFSSRAFVPAPSPWPRQPLARALAPRPVEPTAAPPSPRAQASAGAAARLLRSTVGPRS
jgi:hypothetical protein